MAYTNYKDAFEAFKKRFLIDKKSIFHKDSDAPVLTKESIDYLIKNFVEKGDDSKESFSEKLKNQIAGTKEKTEVKKQAIEAIEVMATAVWFWRLAPLNTTQNARKDAVKEILDLDGDLKVISLDENCYFDSGIKGFAAPGMYYYTNKPFELAYIIRFFEKCLDAKPSIQMLLSLTVQEKGKTLVGKVAITTEEKQEIKSVAVYNALLHLFEPNNYIPALSFDHKKKMAGAFSDKLDNKEENNDVDKQLIQIISQLKVENSDFSPSDFYKPEYREKWDPTILPAKNVIYYGAPGTGKTYQVTKLVKCKTKSDKFYKIQQFHPSFGYEDFIDGVKPDCIGTNGMQFKLVNGEFKELCIEAFKELVRCKGTKEEPKQFYFIADEINRAELSRVFGELLLCLEEDKRLRFDKEGNLQGVKIKTQNSRLWSKEHAVVVMEGDKVVGVEEKEGQLEYKTEGEYYFGVPENIYFLGTMNDIDRSIDSFDLALRRRFTWVHKNCDYNVIAEDLVKKGANEDTLLEYLSDGKGKVGRCILLNDYISQTLNLGRSYELGHSYYMKINVRNGGISKAAYQRLFDYEMAPLLTEYLRAEYVSKDLDDKLKEMRKLFTTGGVAKNK